MGWEDDWPANWKHGQVQTCERSGPWLVLSGTVSTDQGDWLMRDAYIAEGHRSDVFVAGSGRANSPRRNVTLSVRWQTPHAGASLMLPGFCYYGNPSGSESGSRTGRRATRAKPGEELFCEEHRLTMPSSPWNGKTSNDIGAALHTLPSLAPHANKSRSVVVARTRRAAIGPPSWPCFPGPVRSTADAALSRPTRASCSPTPTRT